MYGHNVNGPLELTSPRRYHASMSSGSTTPSPGFTPDALTFLRDVHRKNSKAWFDGHKEEYEQVLLAPLRQLVMDVSGAIVRIDVRIEIAPLVNKTISRLYRDTRFSIDKSLFKDAVWVTFKRPSNEWRDYPGFFFELRPTAYRFGMGFYSATPTTMAAFRELIQQKKRKFWSAIRFLQGQDVYVVEGDSYKRDLKLDLPPELQTYAQRKNLYVVCNRKPDRELFSSQLVTSIKRMFERATPLYHFMQEAAEACAHGSGSGVGIHV